jgi:hypothetical protein
MRKRARRSNPFPRPRQRLNINPSPEISPLSTLDTVVSLNVIAADEQGAVDLEETDTDSNTTGPPTPFVNRGRVPAP